MKELINQWFEQSAPFEGILACGVRHPDQTVVAKTWSDGFTEVGMENALRCVADCFQVLQLNRIPLARRWPGDDGGCARCVVSRARALGHRAGARLVSGLAVGKVQPVRPDRGGERDGASAVSAGEFRLAPHQPMPALFHF